MILNETEVTERMNSPLNLLNRLRSASKSKSEHHNIISIPPTSSEVIENLEDKLAYGSIKSKAANIMIAAMDELKLRLPEISKPESLARVAESMSKVVNAESINNNKDKLNAPQFHLYAPQFHTEEHYETIYARE
jgi:hypothetical protein